MMKELILGTVQLGLRYGINNRSGKPDQEISNQILEYAYLHGVTFLDTAADYGNSEEVIGQFIRNTNKIFEVGTKLSPQFDCDSEHLYDRLKEQVKKSIQQLGVEKITVYYLHSFSHCKNSKLLDALALLKKEKLIQKIGISIYEPSELEYILNYCADIFDVVQLPFNILDHARWLKDGLLNRAKQHKIQIYVRSILLQGLLFKEEKDEIIGKLGAERYIRFLNQLAARKNTEIIRMAYSFVNSINEIDGILVGCESMEQIRHNVELRNETSVLDSDDIDHIAEFCSSIDNKIIDPRKW